MKWPRCHDSPGKIMAEFKPGSNRKPLRSERSFNILGVPRSVLKSGRSGGMADAPDSKSGPRKWVWVQVPPSAIRTCSQSERLENAVPPVSLQTSSGAKKRQLHTATRAGVATLPAVMNSADENGASR